MTIKYHRKYMKMMLRTHRPTKGLILLVLYNGTESLFITAYIGKA